MSTEPPNPTPYGTPSPPPPGYPGAAEPQAYATTQLAGFWRRLAAYIIDAIVVGIVTGVIVAVINGIVQSTVDTQTYSSRSGFVGLIIGLAYFGWLWGTRGQTLGYMALSTRVTRSDGSPITVGRALIRYLALYVSGLLCGIPLIISAFMIALSQRKQGIHDLIADTVVVRTG
jgi:uncharacterized RDD family membrane protein YckC